MDPNVLAGIAGAIGVVLTAIFGYLGVRGSNRRQAAQEQRDADLNRLRTVIDEMDEQIKRTAQRATEAESRTDECERREVATRREMALMRQTMETLVVRDQRRQMGQE